MSFDWKPPLPGLPDSRPLAHVATSNAVQRAEIAGALREQGWAVVDSQSGYHLLQQIAAPVLGEQPWWEPKLVVVDAFSARCSGLTIARGLRDLGWSVAAVVIVNSAEHAAYVADDPDNGIYVASRDLAVRTVLEVAKWCMRSHT